MIQERKCDQCGSHTVFYNLTSEVTYHHFCHILLVTETNPGALWEGLHQSVNIRKLGTLGTVCLQSTTCIHSPPSGCKSNVGRAVSRIVPVAALSSNAVSWTWHHPSLSQKLSRCRSHPTTLSFCPVVILFQMPFCITQHCLELPQPSLPTCFISFESSG